MQGMRESSCPSLIQGEERGVFLELWRRDEWHAGLLSVCWLAFVIAPSSRGKALRHSSPCRLGLFYLRQAAIRHSLCPCARCLWLPATAVALVQQRPGGLGWWSLSKPSPSRRVTSEHPPGQGSPSPIRGRSAAERSKAQSFNASLREWWGLQFSLLEVSSFSIQTSEFPPFFSGSALLEMFWFGFALLCSPLASCLSFSPHPLIFSN